MRRGLPGRRGVAVCLVAGFGWSEPLLASPMPVSGGIPVQSRRELVDGPLHRPAIERPGNC